MISVQSFSSSKYPRLLFSYSDLCTFFFFFNPVVYSTKSIPRSDKQKPNSPAPQSRKRISRHVSETPPQAPSRKPSSPVPQSRKEKSRHVFETPSPKPKVKHHLEYQVAAGTTPHVHNPEVTMHSLKRIMMAVVILQPTLPQLRPSSTLIRHVYYSSILRRDN